MFRDKKPEQEKRKSMAKKVTMEDIARELRVSKSLVSKALSGKYNVNSEISRKIIETAKKLQYPISYQSTVESHSGNVVVIVDREGFSNTAFWVKIIDRLESELKLCGFNMILRIVEDGDASYKPNGTTRADAFIVMGLVNQNLLKELKKQNLPIILMDYKITVGNYTHIRVNNRLGILQMMDLIAEKKHRHLLFSGSCSYAASFRERFEGVMDYINAHPELNMKLDHVDCSTSLDVLEKKEEFLSYMKQKDRATVIICCNDSVALEYSILLKNAGYRLPQDISIVGFDNIRESSLVEPKLTTVEVPKTELAIATVENLIRKLRNPDALNRLVLIEPKVIIRESLIERRNQT